MNRALAITAAVGAAVALIVGSFALAIALVQNGSTPSWKAETVRFQMTDENCSRTSASEDSAKLGDQTDCTYVLRDVDHADKKLGSAAFVCGVVGKEAGVCMSSLKLDKGWITLSGLLIDGEPQAVVGGTNAYQGAIGQFSYSESGSAVVGTARLQVPNVPHQSS